MDSSTVNTGQALLVGVLASLIAESLFFFVLRAFDRPPHILRVTDGSFRQTSGDILIEGATIEFSWERRTGLHIGASLVVGLIVFGILFWLFAADL
jgi:hypothetical protein